MVVATPKQPVTLHLIDGSDLTIDVSEIKSMHAEPLNITPTPDGYREFIIGKPIVIMKDGRELVLRSEKPGG